MYASTEQRNRERVRVLADKLYRERYYYLLRIARGIVRLCSCSLQSALRVALRDAV